MPMSASNSNRFQRRRSETRRALVRAARQILAESGDTTASIRSIAEQADVGLGSFYNHFASKQDLFDAAVADALEEYADAIEGDLRALDDPAERVAGGVRLSTRVAESRPQIVRILCHSGLGRIHAGRGPLMLRAQRDMEQGIASGRFAVADPVIALSALNASLLALLELWFTEPEIDSDQAAGTMAEMLLHMLGLPEDEARDVAQRPLGSAG
ncbi:TetR/AcrR family transcriptional regulator [Streptomyces diastatochromogenes]|uniref:TetR/AcrR family transcriptional regulator n=1 Tax=Streptomyces diastatochromogenes TaxID=42236 RepID=UPI0036637569